MSTSILQIIFWACVAAVAYHYAGYPLLLFILSVFSQARSDFLYLIRRGSRRRPRQADCVPRVALLMSVYNEEAVIQAKVRNTLEIDYPAGRLEILFGLDAPSDTTAKLLSDVQSSQSGRINVFHFQARRGKLAVLCDLAQRTSAEILVFTDANTMLERNCIRNLARHFADQRVGAVSGEEVRVVAAGTDPSAESLYWRYESAVKILESRLNCSLGGNGSALAVRHSLFHPRKQSIVEDFQIPLEIRFEGHRVIYDPEAVAIEEIAPTFSTQFARRVRISAGNYQTLFGNLEYLNPLKGFLAFSFFSHRVLRWLVPLFLVVAFSLSIALFALPGFVWLAAAQCIFYSMAVLGYWLKKQGRRARLFSLPFHFCAMNAALLLGLFAYLSGRQSVTWKSTPRQMPAEMLLNNTGTTDGIGQRRSDSLSGMPEGQTAFESE
ncbi:MAG TPA: glycosyltransferase family 2 protein [Terriglobales bacterium]|jgi:cellulose synthase/poly-beta-1,6-N-acetylglucosamine synthase-like glycosyltransferase|nr:glycosyltransferase family 2 protein [Terriglobales bacterium]